jgi:hypothetical protein
MDERAIPDKRNPRLVDGNFSVRGRTDVVTEPLRLANVAHRGRRFAEGHAGLHHAFTKTDFQEDPPASRIRSGPW